MPLARPRQPEDAAAKGSAVAAARLVAEVERGRRAEVGLGRWLIPALAAAWSLFQLSLPYALILNSDLVRIIHLVFAISLVYLSFPTLRRPHDSRLTRWLSDPALRWFDVALAVLAAAAAAYYAWDYVGIASRQGLPSRRDIAIGLALIALLLEAARRALGPALPIAAMLFIGLSFLGERLPPALAFKSSSLAELLGQLTLSTEGIYGMPLYVSATTVFLYVLFGSLLETSGGGRYFVRLAFCLMGRFRGGPGKAAVLASGLLGLVSGSSIANTVASGTFTIPLMRRAGYPAEKAAAIEVAASTNGQLMPPVMGAAAFLIAERCGLPYLEVARAALIPAFISYIGLLCIVHLEAAKLGLQPLAASEVPRFREVFPEGAHFLAPIGLLVLLLMRRLSPELAAFWAIVALVALVVVRDAWRARRERRRLAAALAGSLRLLWKSLVTGARNMMGIGVAVATAGIIVGVMTLGAGGMVTETISKLSGGSLIGMLLLTAVASLILGMGLPTTANYIVVSTLVVPALLVLAGRHGIAIPLVAAHLFCFFFGILADDTPPVGLAAYAASAIARSDPIRTGIQGFTYDLRTAILPFMFVFNTDLLLIGVTSVWYGALVFVAGGLAMGAFAALTQGRLARRNRLHESLLLLLTVAILLRPGLFAACVGESGGRAPWYGLGILCFLAVYGLQTVRFRRAPASAGSGEDSETPGSEGVKGAPKAGP